jgi:tetratricopeptide (TPR) repeat protein
VFQWLVSSTDAGPELTIEGIQAARTIAELGALLRQLRRREARRRGDSPLTYRELAARTGWAHGVIGDYFAGKTLPPTDRLDVLVGLLGATPAETGALATARDRVEEHRRSASPAPAPRELPRDVMGFVGRHHQLAELDRLLLEAGAAQVAVISGTAGVGKTALAVRWAHHVAARFPDGCLYADLAGYGPDEPVRPEVALAGFLRSLGVSPARPGELPPRPAELAARYRSALSTRRVLIVLDNARSADQVRPLLPGARSCVTLVTSRDRLAGLVARDGAVRVDVDLLPAAEAGALLRQLIGPRAEAEPPATAELAQRCARLPLALRVAAELAVSRPASRLVDLVAELGEPPKRLDLFDAGGDPGTAVREIFSWSYRHLSAPVARMFRLLGLHPGVSFDAQAAAALAGVDVAAARRLLDDLARAHLIEPASPGRHRMHDLLRAYATERAAAEETRALDSVSPHLVSADEHSGAHASTSGTKTLPAQPDTIAALGRLYDHYLATAAAATATAYPADSSPADDTTTPARFSTPADALAWLDAERPNLIAVAVASTKAEHAAGLSQALWRYLDSGGHYDEALWLHEHARRTARDQGDTAAEVVALAELGRVYGRLGRFEDAADRLAEALALGVGVVGPEREASMLNSIAVVYGRLGRFPEAVEHFERARLAYRRGGDRASEGKTLGNLGIVHAELGDYRRAVEHFAGALELARAVGDRIGEGDALSNLAHANYLLGNYADAAQQHQRALEIGRETGDRAGEGRMLASLGLVYAKLGRRGEAFDALRGAVRLQRRAGDRSGEAEALSYLADLHHAAGDHRAAVAHAEQALTIAVSTGERGLQARALNACGQALHALDQPESALARHRAALELASAIGDRLQWGLALDRIGRCLLDTGDGPGAAEHLKRALTLLSDLGVPEAARTRECLDRLPASGAVQNG